MRPHPKCLLAFTSVLLVLTAACGHPSPPTRIATTATTSTSRSSTSMSTTTLHPPATTSTRVDMAAVARWVEASNRAEWYAAVAKNAAGAARQGAPTSRGATPAAPPTVSNAGGSPCGGDLPPCYVCMRESRCTYGAHNPTGCGGAGCFGKWQFSGEWAGKLGLPSDLSTATPAQQDAAARALWRGGAGCSNWAAC